MSITASGSSASSRYVYVGIFSGNVACGSTAVGMYSGAGYYSSPVSGAFSRSTSFTPSAPGTYTVCGWVAQSYSGTADVTQRTTFAVRQATATLTLASSADPAEDIAMSITASGSSASSRYVYVGIFSGNVACGSTAVGMYGGVGYYSSPVSGAFSRSTSFTPSAPGTYTVCGWVAQSYSGTADTTQRATFTVRQAHATLSLTSSPNPTAGTAMSIAVSGTTETGRYVYFGVFAGDVACDSTAVGIYVGEGYYSSPVNGAFSQSASVTPSSAGAHTICGYVAQSLSGTPDATQRATFSASPDPKKPAATSSLGTSSDFGFEGAEATPLPAPNLLSPVDGLQGQRANPTFSWTTDAKYGASHDRLRIQREDEDGTTTKLIDVTTKKVVSYVDADGEEDPSGTEYDTEDLATFQITPTTASITLDYTLPPGKYSWFVLRASGDVNGDLSETANTNSARRSFTVLGPHLRKLRLRKKSTRAGTFKYPGYTSVSAATTPFARVRFDIRRQGREAVFFTQADDNGAAGIGITWSCKHAGGTYRVTATASDQYGAERHRSVKFRPASKRRCRSLRRAEAAARHARERKRAAAQRAADRRWARRQAARIRRYKHNCRAIGGTPRTVEREDGTYWICVSPYGGTLSVPGFDY